MKIDHWLSLSSVIILDMAANNEIEQYHAICSAGLSSFFQHDEIN